MEPFESNGPAPNDKPKFGGCLIALLIFLVILLIGWSMCGQQLGV